MIQDLALQCNILSECVNHINRSRPITHRVIDSLKKMPTPPIYFDDWMKTVTIRTHHLHHVYNFDLTDGIKRYIDDRIIEDGFDNIPIRAFKEKLGTLYIFNRPGSWDICTQEKLNQYIRYISHQYIIELVRSENVQQSALDVYMYRLGKISGHGANLHRQHSYIKSFILSKIYVSLEAN